MAVQPVAARPRGSHADPLGMGVSPIVHVQPVADVVLVAPEEPRPRPEPRLVPEPLPPTLHERIRDEVKARRRTTR